mgnify:FL=1
MLQVNENVEFPVELINRYYVDVRLYPVLKLELEKREVQFLVNKSLMDINESYFLGILKCISSQIRSLVDWDRESSIILYNQLEHTYGGAYSVIMRNDCKLVM